MSVTFEQEKEAEAKRKTDSEFRLAQMRNRSRTRAKELTAQDKEARLKLEVILPASTWPWVLACDN